MQNSSGEFVYDTIAWLGGPENVALLSVVNGLEVQLFLDDTPVLWSQHLVVDRYEDGALYVLDEYVIWKNVSAQSNRNVVSIKVDDALYPLVEQKFYSVFETRDGEFRVTVPVPLYTFTGLQQYHDSLVKFGFIEDRVVDKAYAELQKTTEALMKM